MKWGRVPVWEHAGILTTGETYKTAVKMTFARGASLADPSGLFNSSLDGNMRRAIDFHEGDVIDEEALKALIRAAVALNTSLISSDEEARDVIAATALETGLPVDDPVRFGAERLWATVRAAVETLVR